MFHSGAPRVPATSSKEAVMNGIKEVIRERWLNAERGRPTDWPDDVAYDFRVFFTTVFKMAIYGVIGCAVVYPILKYW
jgi:hypothetical protein